MISLVIKIGVVLFALPIAVTATSNNKKRKIKVGLMTASLPWHFGPYQSQMHKLSLLLNERDDNDDVEYDLYWLNYADPHIPKGVYKTYNELRPHIPKSIPPPDGFPLDHLTFLGQTMAKQMTPREFNKVKKQYGLDCLITLMDITNRVVPDGNFNMPVLAWVPLHSEKVSLATSDYWALRMYHGIASLAPSSAKAINDAVGKEIELNIGSETGRSTKDALKQMYGTVQVDFIPHIFDRHEIMALADKGLNLLKDYSVAEADAKLLKSTLINRGQASTLESGHPQSLFGNERKDDFLVLIQGGNYDEEDRKGWDTSIQAFVQFYNSLEDPSEVHLLIHSMESYLIASDIHLEADAPAAILPQGFNLRYILHEHGLPSHAYTIDICKHAPEVVAAYKKRADVCLHPSKVEGFGMNVLECQVVGTPVITTNYTAMGDYTKLGRSVPHQQTIRSPHGAYRMALPDVRGIANAIGEIFEEHVAMELGDEEALAQREDEITQFNNWVDQTCSPSVVRDKFKTLLLRTNQEFKDRVNGKKKVISSDAPSTGGYEIVTGYHAPIVHWDTPWTLFAPNGLKILHPQQLHQQAWMAYLRGGDDRDRTPMVMVLPAKYEDGTDVPFQNNVGDIHEDLPVFVSTFMVTAIQAIVSRRKSILLRAIQNSGEPILMQQGMAIVDRKKESDRVWSRIQSGEL